MELTPDVLKAIASLIGLAGGIGAWLKNASTNKLVKTLQNSIDKCQERHDECYEKNEELRKKLERSEADLRLVKEVFLKNGWVL